MKKSLLYILAVLVGSLLFGACDKHDSASDPAPNSYSEFFINPPSFNTPSGSKVYWDDDGLWWSPSGDLVLINGTQFQIIKGDGNQWKTQSTESVEERIDVEPKDGVFYCCYIGRDPQTSSLVKEDGRYLYKGVNLANIVPLVGASDDNNVTLKPCCAVFRLHFPEDLTVDLQNNNVSLNLAFDRDIPQGFCDLDPVRALVSAFDNPGEGYTAITFSSSDIDNLGYAYVIVPMDANQFVSSVGIYDEESLYVDMSTNASYQINKGYVYCVEVQAVNK